MSFRNEKLGSITEIVSGSTPDTTKKEFWDGEINWVTPKDLSGLESAYLNETPRKITQAGLQSCSSRMLPSGSVLFSSRAPIGHVAINTVPMCSNQGFKSFVPDSAKLFNKYLYYWLKANRPMLENLGNGATFKEVSKAIISNVEIPLPPLNEQKRIATVLDKADEVRRKRRQAIKKLDELLQSVFLDMFGDPVTNPKGWESGSIELVVKNKSDVRCGPFGTQLKVDELVDFGIPLYGIENVRDNKFNPKVSKFLTENKAEQLNAFDIKPNDVLITRMGTIGKACVVPANIGKARFSYHLFRVRPDIQRCLPKFLTATINRSGTFQNQLRNVAHGAIMAGLNTTNLKQVKFLLPPIFNQNKYVEIVEKIEIEKEKLEFCLSKKDLLFESLQQRAFAGELFGADDLVKEARSETLF